MLSNENEGNNAVFTVMVSRYLRWIVDNSFIYLYKVLFGDRCVSQVAYWPVHLCVQQQLYLQFLFFFSSMEFSLELALGKLPCY